MRAHVRAIKVTIDEGSNLCGNMEITIATEPHPTPSYHPFNSNMYGVWKGGKKKNSQIRETNWAKAHENASTETAAFICLKLI